MSQTIRNVAVIAHVDHGKTTLVDALLKQTHTFRENQEEMQVERILDRNELERERGITILAKNCAIIYKDAKINIIDTPGHADFSGEVERTLGMADGALLIVDAHEGPMPQTRFVLRKALSLGLKIIVVINKIDKPYARVTEVRDKIETLFLELAANDAQLDFPVLYAIGRRGAAFVEMPDDINQEADVTPILDTILDSVPAPKADTDAVFKMVVTSMDYDPHLGRIIIGKINSGKVSSKQKVIVTDQPQAIKTVEKVFSYRGLERIEVEEAYAGDVVAFSGISDVTIGKTVSDPSDTESLPAIAIAEPTLHMLMGPNTSPFAGQEGDFTTSRQIEERLRRELESNLSLRVEFMGNGKFLLSGRGELHLSVLLETMRREGYEMEVAKPEVIVKDSENGKLEPVEEVTVVVPNEFQGVINQEFGKRFGVMLSQEPASEVETQFIYRVPTRALIGLRSLLLTMTKGTILMSSQLLGYEPIGKSIPSMRRGVIISDQMGEALAYGLAAAQERGITFIEPATKVYEGMIVGQNAKEEDMIMNICKGKKLTNMRSTSSDGIIQLAPATTLSLEQSLDFLESDELLEITPHSLRLRKKHLTEVDRRRAERSGK